MGARTKLIAALLVFVVWLIPGSPALAKGPADKIALDGPGLADSVEITDPVSLAPFDPWFRSFIVWELVSNSPPAEQAYTVTFYHRQDGRTNCLSPEGKFCVTYMVLYSPDPSGGPGHIYFPGPGEPRYRLNIGTIITGDSDLWNPNGKWHYASERADATMRRALVLPARASPIDSRLWAPVLAVIGLLAGGAGLLGLRLRRRPA